MADVISVRPARPEKSESLYGMQGTADSSYEERGPYHCEDCVHKTAMDEPFCIHPEVISDKALKSRLVKIDGKSAVKINMEHGCCKFVKQEKHEEDEEE